MSDLNLEVLLGTILGGGSGGGGTGTTNYNALTNKPQINGVILSGNKTAADLGIESAASLQDMYDTAATNTQLKSGTNTTSLSPTTVSATDGTATASVTKSEVKVASGTNSSSVTSTSTTVKSSTDTSTITPVKVETKDSTDTASLTKTEVKVSDSTDTFTATKTEVKVTDGADSARATKSLVEVKNGTTLTTVKKNEVKTTDGTDTATITPLQAEIKDSTKTAAMTKSKVEVVEGSDSVTATKDTVEVKNGSDVATVKKNEIKVTDGTDTLTETPLKVELEDEDDSLTATKEKLEITDGTDTTSATKTELKVADTEKKAVATKSKISVYEKLNGSNREQEVSINKNGITASRSTEAEESMYGYLGYNTVSLNDTFKEREFSVNLSDSGGVEIDKEWLLPKFQEALNFGLIAKIKGSPVDEALSVGRLILYGGNLYRVTTAIASGSNIVTSGASANVTAIRVDEVIAELTAKDDAQQAEIDYAVNSGKKNLLASVGADSATTNGITFTKNSDGSVTATGTATADAAYNLNNNSAYYISLTSGKKYTLSKGTTTTGTQLKMRTTSSGSSIAIVSGENASVDYTPSADLTVFVYINVIGGTTLDNEVFYPMLRDAAITDDTYVQYAMSNAELTGIATVKNVENGTDYFDGGVAIKRANSTVRGGMQIEGDVSDGLREQILFAPKLKQIQMLTRGTDGTWGTAVTFTADEDTGWLTLTGDVLDVVYRKKNGVVYLTSHGKNLKSAVTATTTTTLATLPEGFRPTVSVSGAFGADNGTEAKHRMIVGTGGQINVYASAAIASGKALQFGITFPV